MSQFTITVDDRQVQAALEQLAQRMGNVNPVLRAVGEDIISRTKHRFDISTSPDGAPWQPNSPVTLALFQGGFGKSLFKKSGGRNKAGQAKPANKKPLIGESQDLSRQFSVMVSDGVLTVGSTVQNYAAIQQFGGQAGRGHKVTISARPFLPVRPDGSLYRDEQDVVLSALNLFLLDGL
jgi:phage gpG-like protein